MIFYKKQQAYKVVYNKIPFGRFYLSLFYNTSSVANEWEDTKKFLFFDTLAEMQKIIEKTDDEIIKMFDAYIEEFEKEEAYIMH